MDDRRAHFLTMLGDAATAAGVASIPVRLFLRNGRNLTGMPSPEGAAVRGEVDETGYAKGLLLNGTEVQLDQVTGFSIYSP